jgi:6,7-dimethyl-8-ribityllumazine synthase
MATVHQNTLSINLANVPSAKGLSFGIVVSEWNTDITESLYHGAYDLLIAKGASANQIKRVNVPGSFELIYGSKILQKENLDAIIAIGSVIQGETKHFDFVCQATAMGIKDLNVQGSVPVIFCVLTDNTLQQAKDRSGGKLGNKGTEAAIAAIKMARV